MCAKFSCINYWWKKIAFIINIVTLIPQHSNFLEFNSTLIGLFIH